MLPLSLAIVSVCSAVQTLTCSCCFPLPPPHQLSEYDSVSRLDEWLTKHFLVVKKKINAALDDIN